MNLIFQADELLNEVRRVVREELAQAGHASQPWLSVKRAAEYLDTSPDAVYGLVKRGELVAHHSGNGRLLFERDALDAWARAGDGA